MQRSTDTPISKLPAARVPSGSERPLVVPHPLDFDWRFTRDTIGLIWQTVRELAYPQSDLALLGTPSLAATVEPWKELGSVTLHERNPTHYRSLSDGITFACCDVLRDPIAGASNGVVVADPPWYEAETIGFLWTASTLSRTGAHVLLSLPPVATRPGVKEERERITTAAVGFGLEFVRLSEGVLRYSTPFFETNAMRAAGAPVTNDWRLGDLEVFRRTGGECGPRTGMDGTIGGTDTVQAAGNDVDRIRVARAALDHPWRRPAFCQSARSSPQRRDRLDIRQPDLRVRRYRHAGHYNRRDQCRRSARHHRGSATRTGLNEQ